jgi:hypothetical protein
LYLGAGISTMHLIPDQIEPLEECSSGSETKESKFEVIIYVLIALIFGFLIFSMKQTG